MAVLNAACNGKHVQQSSVQPVGNSNQRRQDPMQRVLPRFKWGNLVPLDADRLVLGGNPVYRFYRIVPDGVMYVSAGLGGEDLEPESIKKAIAHYWDGVEVLAKEKVDVIILGGAPVSALLGRVRVRELLDEITRRTGIRADATFEAALAGMAHLGVKKIAVGSSLSSFGAKWENQNQAISDYYQAGGVQVVAFTSGGQTRTDMSFEGGLRSMLELGYEAARKGPDADGIYIPGGVMAEQVIDPIEEEFGKPVFTQLNTLIWNNLVRTKVIPPIQWGRLLATP